MNKSQLDFRIEIIVIVQNTSIIKILDLQSDILNVGK